MSKLDDVDMRLRAAAESADWESAALHLDAATEIDRLRGIEDLYEDEKGAKLEAIEHMEKAFLATVERNAEVNRLVAENKKLMAGQSKELVVEVEELREEVREVETLRNENEELRSELDRLKAEDNTREARMQAEIEDLQAALKQLKDKDEKREAGLRTTLGMEWPEEPLPAPEVKKGIAAQFVPEYDDLAEYNKLLKSEQGFTVEDFDGETR